MQVDPFPDPIPLAQSPAGGWTWSQEKPPLSFKEQNFWRGASRLLAFRRANGKKKIDYEQCQMDFLIYNRKRIGKQTTNPAYRETVATQRALAVAAFKKRHVGGCRGCGKKPKPVAQRVPRIV